MIELNHRAMQRMTASTRLEIVPGATHLFEEPGTLEQVCHLAADWCEQHLVTARLPSQDRSARRADTQALRQTHDRESEFGGSEA